MTTRTTQTYVLGDPRDVLPTYGDGVFQTCVTSPPYLHRRAYGVGEREIGMGTLSQYLNDLREVFAEVKRTLNDTGILWVNVGDTATGTGGSGGDYMAGNSYAGRGQFGANAATWIRDDGTRIANKQWALVPYRLADALERDGWLLRSSIIWNKRSSRREDKRHTRRPGEQHEHVLMFVKRPRRASDRLEYRYLHEREVEPGDVWTFSKASGKGNGKAPFPVELPRRCIAVSCKPGEAVLDPFVGVGATLWAAHELGCDGVGVDLDREAAAIALSKAEKLGVPMRQST